ncbi:MAG: hypothetical protein R6V45_05190, partial [Oceanipulchritudo sp.]
MYLQKLTIRLAGLASIALCSHGSLFGGAHANQIPAELFDPGFLEGDSNYHSLTPASDGLIYFTIGTHHADTSARFYAFDPRSDDLSEIARMDEVLGQDPLEMVPHGKIHTPLIEDEG